MKKQIIKFLGLLVITQALISCAPGKVQDTLGMRREVPDEFSVVANPPLSIPPSFALRPPHSIAVYENVSAEYKAEKSLTRGEQGFLSRVGVDDADPNIKAILEKESRIAADSEKDDGFFDKLGSFGKKKEQKEALVVDANAERERISKNKKEGKPVNEGEVPTLDSSDNSGILNKIFGN